jgi:predicted HTH transcriptional regulator
MTGGIFILGALLGGLVVYFLVHRKKSIGIATYVAKQKNEKEARKEKILEMIREKGNVTNNDIETVLGVSDASATNYLQELEREDKIEQVGERGRFVSYRLKD